MWRDLKSLTAGAFIFVIGLFCISYPVHSEDVSTLETNGTGAKLTVAANDTVCEYNGQEQSGNEAGVWDLLHGHRLMKMDGGNKDVTSSYGAINVAQGTRVTTSAAYKVTEADVLAGKVINEATVSGNSPDPDQSEPGVTPGKTEDLTKPLNPSLFVKKTAEPSQSGGYQLGDSIPYTIEVLNNGNVTIEDIIVTDDLTKGSWMIQSLVPGAKETVTTNYTVREADVIAGKVINVAAAGGNAPNGTTIEGEATETVEVGPANPHLSITKDVAGTPAKGTGYALGETIHYKITAINDGNLTLTDVKITDQLTKDSWTVGTLAPGDSSSEYTASYQVTEQDIRRGLVLNEATGTARTPDQDNPVPGVTPGVKEVPTEAANAGYTVSKAIVAPQAEYRVGATVQYQIVLTNTGNVILNNVNVGADLQGAAGQAVFTYVGDVSENVMKIDAMAGFALQGAAGKDILKNADNIRINGNNVTINKIAPGKTVKLNCEYKLLREDAGSTIRCIVRVKTDETGDTPGEDVDKPLNISVVPLYSLTIHYVDTAGTVLAPDYTGEFAAGDPYSVASPVIDGYTPDYEAAVSGVDGMPAEDVELTVTYTATKPAQTAPLKNSPGTGDYVHLGSVVLAVLSTLAVLWLTLRRLHRR